MTCNRCDRDIYGGIRVAHKDGEGVVCEYCLDGETLRVKKWRVEFQDWRDYWNEYDTYSDRERAVEIYEKQPQTGRRLIRVEEYVLKESTEEES